MIESKLIELNHSLELRQNKGFEEAKEVVITGVGKNICN